MMNDNAAVKMTKRNGGGLLLLLLCLAAILGALFLQSFDPSKVLFANDGPLGIQKARCFNVWEGFSGIWYDLYWLGSYSGSWTPNLSRGYTLLLDPRSMLSFYPALTCLLIGACAWLFLRTLGFQKLACVLGGLAAALNMNFFSNACWGLASRGVGLALIFLALAALESGLRRFSILKTILAGFAIGMSIAEMGDNGAIFSLFVAAYAVFVSLTQEGPLPARIAKGLGKSALMAVCAALLAIQSLGAMWSTSVKGVVGMEQGDMDKETRWSWATQWSLPKAETLRVIIPGLFGYRLDTPDGGNYWGKVGQQPGWEKDHQGFPRHSGSGEYAGVLVALVALWALANSLAGVGGAFSLRERRAVWFWGAMALVSLLLAWGRFAPFYHAIYVLPYFSSIRNPMKFMHPFHMTLMILFAYGVQGLARRYLEPTLSQALSLQEHLKAWWSKANSFEKKWNYTCVVALALGALGFLIYTNSREELAVYLGTAGFDLTLGRQIARFSAHEVAVFVVLLAVCASILLVIQSGALAGKRAGWAGFLLGTVLVLDLARADVPWIKYEVIAEKYAMNPVLEKLSDHPYLHRVTVPNLQVPQQVAQWNGLLQQVYHIEWLQHHFMFNNIQALEVAQMSRVPEDYAAFNKALAGSMLRLWQLTNTRYILALAGFVDAFNAQIDPVNKRFRQTLLFDITQRPGGGVTAVPTTNGPFALIEFTGALDRAKLYTNWEVSPNDAVTLKRLADPSFDPAQSVFVADPIAAPASSNAGPATVEWISYAPTQIRLRTLASAPTVLLLNDRWNPDWQVSVDGKPTPLLRCNYVMQGAALPPGAHNVEFRFLVKSTTFYISLGVVLAGFLIAALVCLLEIRRRIRENTDESSR